MKDNNPLFYLPSSQLFPAPIPEGNLYCNSELMSQIRLAKEYSDKNELETALGIYNQLIDSYPGYAFLYACRSLLKSSMDENEGAFYDYQVAKQMDFNYHHVLEWLGNVGQMQESEELLDLINATQFDEQFYINRATLYVQHFEYEKAVEDFSKAYEIGHNPVVLASRGAVRMRMVRYDYALADFNEALAKDPSLTKALILRAKLYYTLRENELADIDFSKAIELEPTEITAYEERAQFYEAREQYDLAIADYSVMIALGEDDFYGYVLRADLYEKLGKMTDSLADYDRAIELNPYYSDLYQYRGDIRKALGDSKGAEEDYRKFEELEDE